MSDQSLQSADPAANGSERAQRLVKLRRLNDSARNPFGGAFPVSGTLAELRAAFQEGLSVRAAGRLTTLRDMGKTIFADLRDGSDRLQVYAGKSNTDDFKNFKHCLDAGDLIGVEGELFVTRMGEQTLRVQRWTMLAKSLHGLPEKWHGLKDVETRYRRRYLDLIVNPDVRRVFDQRAKIIRAVREFLWARGFQEVETPMMQPQAGGAAARPFKTRYTALATDMFLRIAPELYLKRLLVGGYARIFELNRNFRNEGLSKTHNPEFTMLEIYEAWSDVSGMRVLAQELIVAVAREVIGSLQVGHAENSIDLTPPWREATYRELVLERAGADWYTLAPQAAAARATTLGLHVEPSWNHMQITHEIYEKLIERSLRNPTFVTRLPAELVPLAKTCADDASAADVFELVIDGKEVAPGYSELNDPILQRQRLEAQSGEDAQKVDEDFLLALEHGMPPAGGMGIGIDRLVMILTGSDTIRDVILFPQLRP